MLDLFYIEGMCCIDGQCDVYTGEVSVNDIMLGEFSLNSRSGEEALIKLNIITSDVDIAIGGQKRELKNLECITKDDGSWCINQDLGNDKFKIIIKKL